MIQKFNKYLQSTNYININPTKEQEEEIKKMKEYVENTVMPDQLNRIINMMLSSLIPQTRSVREKDFSRRSSTEAASRHFMTTASW